MSEKTATCHRSLSTNDLLNKRLDGRYEIVERLARGGFSQTYIALDLRRPGQPKCVVKHLNLLGEQTAENLQVARKLFNREAEILEKLGSHDQIPRLLAHFEEDQSFYLVQEFIEGKPLSAELEAGCWNEAQTIQLLQETLNILHFVHQRQFIHRDIKPDNIIRRRQDNQFVLVDFGAVKQTPGASQGQTTTAIVSSGIYTPPEQLEGNPRFNSDIYALGMTAIQALTGLSPDVLQQHKDPNTGEIAFQTLPPIREELQAILSKMVRYYFKERYQTTVEVLEALQQLTQFSSHQLQSIPLEEPSTPVHYPSAQEAQSGYTPTQLIIPVQSSSSLSTQPEQLADASGLESVSRSTPQASPSSQISSKQRCVQTLIFTASQGNRLALQAQSFNASIDTWVAQFWKTYTSLSVSRKVIFTLGVSVISLVPAWGVMQYTHQTATSATPIVQSVNPLLSTLTGHTDAVRTLAFSSDGHTLASGSADRTVKIWDLQTQKPILQKDDTGEIFSVAFNSNSQILASSGEDRTIKLWNLQSGALMSQLNKHDWQVASVAFSQDSQTLVSGSQDGAIELWDLRTQKFNRTLSKDANRVNAVAISPDNALLVSGNIDNTIQVWDLSTQKLLRTLKGHSGQVNAISISLNSAVVASGSADGTIKLWNLHTGELLQTLVGHLDSVHSVAFHPDGKTLISGSADQTIKIWHGWTGQLIQSLYEPSGEVLSVAVHPDGQIFASANKGGTIKIWRVPGQTVDANHP
jgi:WD40 repeat protein